MNTFNEHTSASIFPVIRVTINGGSTRKVGGPNKRSVVRHHRGHCWGGCGIGSLIVMSLCFALSPFMKYSCIHPVCQILLLLDHPVGGHSATTINCGIQQIFCIFNNNCFTSTDPPFFERNSSIRRSWSALICPTKWWYFSTWYYMIIATKLFTKSQYNCVLWLWRTQSAHAVTLKFVKGFISFNSPRKRFWRIMRIDSSRNALL